MSRSIVKNAYIYITKQLKQFMMVDARERYQELIDKAVEQKLGYKEFLVGYFRQKLLESSDV